MKKYIIAIILIGLILISGITINKNISYDSDKYVTTSDGVKIAFKEYISGHKEVLIIAPGWFMCKDSSPFEQMAKDFSKDFDVIAMDFRGHCKSKGRYTFTSKEYQDIKSIADYARKKYDKVYVAGFSLGSASAVITEYKYNVFDKLILVSPPDDFEKIENAIWKKEAFIPTFKKLELKTWLGIIPGELWLKKIKPIDVIDKISPKPVLIIAGMKDPTIRVIHSEQLFKQAKEPKRLVIFGDSIHAEDIYLKDKNRFIKLCTDWLKE